MSFHSLLLDDLRDEAAGQTRKIPFQHQLDAFEALNNCFDLGTGQGKAGLLVLPTGAGKTFTTVKWLCDNVLSKNQRVLWLASSFYLLDQAFHELYGYARWIPEPRQTLDVRVVSSNPSHGLVADIQNSDDVVIMTTQTAIKNLNSQSQDLRGKQIKTRFRQWVEASEASGLLIVLDEAHHAPAYGCRHLLIGTDPKAPGLRTLVKGANLLGLTATPTYSDKARRGWLGQIFDAGIVFQADKGKLTAQGILARPNYIPRATGKEVAVPDALYDRLVRDHKDLPEDIIETLAADSHRNDTIVSEYVRNKELYGKTIIFADRWFQCVYLKTKLQEKGIKADAIYSHIDADPGSAEARNQRTASDNERILRDFKSGKDKLGQDTLDVLINVRMLTEGADVPSVRTVFLTRQTTSQILMAQMMGRALRGRQAGGEDEAHIVLFMDEWKRLIPDWATPATLDGETGSDVPVVRGYFPLEYVSIRLVEELSRQINSGGEVAPAPFDRVMPIGWFQTEYVAASSTDDEEAQAFAEFVMVYEGTATKFDAFIAHCLGQLSPEWGREFIALDKIEEQAQAWTQEFFDPDSDDIGNTLALDLVRIARHIAQNQSKPPFFSFEERDRYDMGRLAHDRLRYNALENDAFLRSEFGQPGGLWKTFYKSYERFSTAFDGATRQVLHQERHGQSQSQSGGGIVPSALPSKPRRRRELSEVEKAQVKKRDGHQCLCCGVKGKGVRLQIDHVIPYHLGGETTIDNSQTLCSVCNRHKVTNEICFLRTATPLLEARELPLLPRSGSETMARTITRIVNSFYGCHALYQVHIHQRSNGQFYKTWQIELYAGNAPKWLNRCKKQLLKYVQEELGCYWVEGINVVGIQ